MVSIIGPNGAGKSTALKSIVGFVKVSSGHVRFDGQESRGCGPIRSCPAASLRAAGRIVFPQ